MNLKSKKGITLVALVVTIIVLLILAGVTLKLISGSDGILGKANNAATETKYAAAKEELELYLSEENTEYFNDKYVSETPTTAANLRAYLINKAGENKKIEIEDGKAELEFINETTGEIKYTSTIGVEIKDLIMSENGILSGGTLAIGSSSQSKLQSESTYTIIYNMSGVEGGPSPLNNCKIGERYTLCEKKDVPTRAGYDFDGWLLANPETSSNTITDYQKDSNDINLYASWIRRVYVKGEKLEIINGNSFYVIGGEDSESENLILLLDKSIGTATLDTAKKQAEIYGSGFGGIGRLMTKNEAEDLSVEIRALGSNYWLSTAYGSGAYNIDPSGGIVSGWGGGNTFGVRPVIEVSKTLIQHLQKN